MEPPPIDIVDRNPPPVVVIEVERDWCQFCDTNPDLPAYVPAYLYAKLESGRTLALCAHHGTAAYDKLVDDGALIIDHRDHLRP